MLRKQTTSIAPWNSRKAPKALPSNSAFLCDSMRLSRGPSSISRVSRPAARSSAAPRSPRAPKYVSHEKAEVKRRGCYPEWGMNSSSSPELWEISPSAFRVSFFLPITSFCVYYVFSVCFASVYWTLQSTTLVLLVP